MSREPLGKAGEAPLNALLRNLVEALDPVGKTFQNIPSMMHDSVANVAEIVGADDLAAKRRETAAEKRVEGAPDFSLEDLEAVVKIASGLSPQEIAAAASGIPKIPESLHYSAAKVAKALGADEVAKARMEDAERLRARRTGKDATAQDTTAQEAMDRRIGAALEGLGSAAAKAGSMAKKAAESVDPFIAGMGEGSLLEDFGVSDAEAKKAEEAVAKSTRRAVRKTAKKAAKKVARVADTPVEDIKEAKVGTEATPAEPEVDYTDQAIGLFKTTHNTEFDPKSSMDRGKLEKMKTLLAEKGGLENMGKKEQTKFALDFYRRFPES